MGTEKDPFAGLPLEHADIGTEAPKTRPSETVEQGLAQLRVEDSNAEQALRNKLDAEQLGAVEQLLNTLGETWLSIVANDPNTAVNLLCVYACLSPEERKNAATLKEEIKKALL